MLGGCRTCMVLEERIKYLEGLLDRTMNIIAPKSEEPIDPKLANAPENDRDVIRYGE